MSDPSAEPEVPALLQGSAPPARAAIAIHVAAASKVYPNGLHAVDRVDLQVREGEFATLLGPSGCGKSTLLRVIAGLSTLSSGSVALWPSQRNRTAVDPLLPPAFVQEPGSPSRSAPRLAFVFQSPTLMPWANVRRNVQLPLELTDSHPRQGQRPVEDALELVRLQDFGTLYPRELSGGMQMRASIARALVTQPDLLLMDEPFGALDEITRSRLDLEIRELWARRSLTVMFVTHSIYEAVFLSTRVLVMSARPGRIVGEVLIDEPHPRPEGFRVSERFARWCKQLSEILAGASEDAGR